MMDEDPPIIDPKEYQDSQNFDNEMSSFQPGEVDVLIVSSFDEDVSPRKIWKNVCAAIFITLDVEQSSSVAKYLSVITNLVRMNDIHETDTRYSPHSLTQHNAM